METDVVDKKQVQPDDGAVSERLKVMREGFRPALKVMMRHKTRLSCFVFCFNQDSSRCSPLAVTNTALQRLKVL